MPVLKPLLNDPAALILRETGLAKVPFDEVRDILNQNNLSLPEAARELAFTIRTTNNEAVKLRALETVFKFHGVNDEKGRDVPVVVFNVAGNLNLQQILSPAREVA